ncbi:hypothetical protein ACDZ28_31485 [Paenibacillus sp. RS8]|uniref:hypothetical protein n=1 Tax=Paenibacillus sp. RS8 TaxID=3242681 RepID=UPI0035C137B8
MRQVKWIVLWARLLVRPPIMEWWLKSTVKRISGVMLCHIGKAEAGRNFSINEPVWNDAILELRPN